MSRISLRGKGREMENEGRLKGSGSRGKKTAKNTQTVIFHGATRNIRFQVSRCRNLLKEVGM